MYVYGEEFFEVFFPIYRFLHLTGVETKLSAKDFYKNAKKSKLTNSQFYFDARHPYTIVDFIFSKDASRSKYDSILVEDKRKMIPNSIKHLISDNFYEKDENERK